MLSEQSTKIAAFLMSVLFIGYYGVQFLLHGNTTCQELLAGGSYYADGKWQPSTCMVHHYSKEETSHCLKDKRVLLIGDSRIRQLYYGLLRFYQIEEEEGGEKHSNKRHVVEDENIIFEFLWHSEINDSTVKLYEDLLQQDPAPAVIIQGAATWSIKLSSASDEALTSYRANLSKAASQMDLLSRTSQVVWMMQAPVKNEKFDESRDMITNEVLEKYNQAAIEVLDSSSVKLWYSVEAMTAQYPGEPEADDDGIHVAQGILDGYLQVLFNWHCNTHVKPRGATCCMDSRPGPNIVQIACFAFFIICAAASLHFYRETKSRKGQLMQPIVVEEEKVEANGASGAKLEVIVPPADAATVEEDETLKTLESNLKVFWSLTKFGIIMGYFYLCDRTDIFPRVNKHFHILHFAIPLTLFLIYGVWDNKKVKRPDILNVEQTTEWKGWMQLIILVYHVTGASKNIPIYMQIRDLVATYFFLSGYGQFFVSWSREKFGLIRVCEVLPIYHYARGGPAAYVFMTAYGQYYCCWERGMLGLHRFCAVVFRYNFLVFFLCLVMDRQYQLYYFVPLITFWYFVLYVTMAIYPRATKAKAEENSSYYYVMTIKLVALILIIALLSYSQTFFTMLFDIPIANELFLWPGTSLYEWWFRWQLDRYVVPFGMTFAFCLLTAKAKGLMDDSHADDMFSQRVSLGLTISGVVLHLVHIGRAFLCTDKPSCNSIHVYISFIPIFSVILFRNTLGVLRSYYSVFFAWVGTMSLELFVGQYHVLLAEDTVGILCLVPGYPLINILVTSFIFVCIALEIRDISGVVTVAVIPRADKSNPGRAEKAMLKRLCVFILVLLVLYGYKQVR